MSEETTAARVDLPEGHELKLNVDLPVALLLYLNQYVNRHTSVPGSGALRLDPKTGEVMVVEGFGNDPSGIVLGTVEIKVEVTLDPKVADTDFTQDFTDAANSGKLPHKALKHVPYDEIPFGEIPTSATLSFYGGRTQVRVEEDGEGGILFKVK